MSRKDRILDASKKQLERDEGRKAKLYYDTLNVPSIGIGRNLARGLSDDEIDYLFLNDFNGHYGELMEAFPWAEELDDVRFGALMNMAFNLGIPKLRGFTNMLLALKMKQWDTAAEHALNSIWASEVHGRAYRISEQFRTGEWK